MRLFHNPRRQQGITLLEIMGVVALLAVLSALLLPSLRRVRATADAAGCLSNLRAWGAAHGRYAMDHAGLLPPAQMPIRPEDPDSRLLGWDERLAPYVPFDYQHLLKQSLEARRRSILVCPAETEVREPGDYTYAQNIDLNHRLLGAKALVRLNTLSNLSTYVLMSDSYRSLTLSTATQARLVTSIQPKPERHGGTPNFLYADGHAAPFTARLVGYNEVSAANRAVYLNLWFANGLRPDLR